VRARTSRARWEDSHEYDAIIVGTGFAATVAVSELVAKQKKVLMLERGTWWVTPEKLGAPPAAKPGDPPQLADWAKQNEHPLQYWPRPDHGEGLLDLFASVRHGGNRDGLYVYSRFDDCDILSASGVGGGSLISPSSLLATIRQIGFKPDPSQSRCERRRRAGRPLVHCDGLGTLRGYNGGYAA
jgi:choline dehydrogenase-like flavoprotein